MNSTAPTAPGLLPRFLGKPARPCPRCSGKRFSLNPAGAVACFSCKPPADPSWPILIADLCGKPPRCVWSLPSDFDEAQPQSTDHSLAPAAITTGLGFGGGGPEGRGEVAAAGFGDSSGVPLAGSPRRSGWGDPESRLDPEDGPTALLIVSTRLEHAAAPMGGFWESPDVEVACLPSPGVPDAPAGVWRRLTQPYFAWLVAAVSKMSGDQNREGVRLLREIAAEAMELREFGEWAADVRQWPWEPPEGFDGPIVVGRIDWRRYDWGRGVSGSSLDQMAVFEPGIPGGKDSKNGNGNGRKDDCRGHRGHDRGSRGSVPGGFRRDGFFADDCPD